MPVLRQLGLVGWRMATTAPVTLPRLVRAYSVTPALSSSYEHLIVSSPKPGVGLGSSLPMIIGQGRFLIEVI